MKRRKFLRAAAGTAASVPFLLNGSTVNTMSRSALFNGVDPESDKILVLIQLNGGNDGLNMVLPMDQYNNLVQVRSNIILPENSVLSLTDTLSVHPNMAGIPTLYDEGKMGLVQNVGYPNQNRSHFRSSDIWTSGSPADEFWANGWLGRWMDTLYDDYPIGFPNETYPHPFAITMGSSTSETCQGIASNYSLSLSDPFSLTPLLEGEGGELPDTPYGDELAFLRSAISQSNAYGEVITEIANNANNAVDYPEDNRLAGQLRNIALLVNGGIQTNVFVVNLGGFDTHSDQVLAGDTTQGNHADLLKILSEAIAAFQADLAGLGLEDRVLTMTFSEFGRRIKSNGSLGCDHGTAAPLMLFGTCVNSQILGDNPEINPNAEVGEGVAMQYDFRDIYGSILMDWFEVEENTVKNLLYEEFTHLPILQDCTTVATNDPELEPIGLDVFPNPFHQSFSIKFTSENEHVRLDIFDTLGAQIQNITNRKLPAGQHNITVDLNHLPAGVYFVRARLGNRVQTKRMVKM